MPNTKSALLRQQVIDRCLSSGRRYSARDLMDECNEALALRGFKEVRSLVTIHADLAEIDEQYHDARKVGTAKNTQYTIIEADYIDHVYYYRYWKPHFSIYRLEMNSLEMAGLAQAISILKRFQGMPQFDWVDQMMERFKHSTGYKDDPASVVGFDDNPDLEGKEHFTTLFNAIIHKQPLQLTYHSFKTDEDIVYIVHPYYLKTYNKRWFLLAWEEKGGFLSNYAFDRIVNIKDFKTPFIEHPEINIEEYFDAMVGVSRKLTSPTVKITFWVAIETWPYIKTKPLHGTQKVDKELTEQCEDGVIITIDVIPNFELQQLVLSYGEGIRVLSPDRFRDKIRSRLEQALNNYPTIQLD